MPRSKTKGTAMTVRHGKQDHGRGLVALTEAVRKLATAPKATVPMWTLEEACRQLRVSRRELRLRIAACEFDTVKIGRRVWVLP
jgi:hypothetical protein